MKEYFSKFSPLLTVQCLILLKFYLKCYYPSDEIGSKWELRQGEESTFLHLFILKTYFYEKSKIFNVHKSNTASAAVSIVNLPAHEQQTLKNMRILCVAFNHLGFPLNVKPAHDVAFLFGADDCKMRTHRIVCADARPVMALRINGGGPPIKLNMAQTDGVSRKLVVCASRMFAFENWHHFLTSMELNRIHKVDLVSVHVQSVDQNVFALMKYYEKSGFLRILPSLQMPSSVPTLAFDPNTETHWNHQVVNYEACLYEFRENTEFIAFHDWDEYILTPNITPIYDYMKTLSLEHPLASSFVLQRFSGYMPSLDEMHKIGMNLTSLWQEGFRYSDQQQYAGKPIVRPSMVESVAIHSAFNLSQGTHEMHIGPEGVHIMHARDGKNDMMIRRLSDPEALIANFLDFISRQQIPTEVMEALPKSARLFGPLYDCYFNILHLITASSGSKCGNVNQCKEMLRNTTTAVAAGSHGCIGVDNRWNLVRYKSASIRTVVGILMEEELIKTENCHIHY